MASSSTLSNMEKCLLGSNKDDTFRFLDTLFSVAASRWPRDLCSRRPLIMEKLYAPPPEKKKEEVPPLPPPEKKKKKKKPGMIIRLKIPPALRASQATTTPDDHRHQKAAAAAEKDYSSVAPINKNANNKNATHDGDHKNNTKKIVRAARSDHDGEENSRLEGSINKLNSQYRDAQINQRKIQVVEFQSQNKKKKKNNFIAKLRQEAKKTKPTTKIKQLIRRPPPPQTLTSWIDAQARKQGGGFW